MQCNGDLFENETAAVLALIRLEKKWQRKCEGIEQASGNTPNMNVNNHYQSKINVHEDQLISN
jgi:hypothetical protein